MFYTCNHKFYLIKTINRWHDQHTRVFSLCYTVASQLASRELKSNINEWTRLLEPHIPVVYLQELEAPQSFPPSLPVITACALPRFTALSVCLATPHQHSLPSLMRRPRHTPTPPENLQPTFKSILARTRIHTPTDSLQNAKTFNGCFQNFQ